MNVKISIPPKGGGLCFVLFFFVLFFCFLYMKTSNLTKWNKSENSINVYSDQCSDLWIQNNVDFYIMLKLNRKQNRSIINFRVSDPQNNWIRHIPCRIVWKRQSQDLMCHRAVVACNQLLLQVFIATFKYIQLEYLLDQDIIRNQNKMFPNCTHRLIR